MVTDYLHKNYTTTIDSPEIFSLITRNALVFDCYLGKPEDVQELLKDRSLDHKKIQTFLTSKYKYRQSWYE